MLPANPLGHVSLDVSASTQLQTCLPHLDKNVQKIWFCCIGPEAHPQRGSRCGLQLSVLQRQQSRLGICSAGGCPMSAGMLTELCQLATCKPRSLR